MSRLFALTVVVVAVCAACSGGANPLAPSPFTVSPAGLDRAVEGGGGGGFGCFLGQPCPTTGSLRIDAGDADLAGLTVITQSATDPFSFVAVSSSPGNLAGHIEATRATIDVADRTMSVELSLVAPNGEPLELSGEAEVVQTETRNSGCASGRQLLTEATFIFPYLGKTVISEVHCIVP
jgi:hypothetical protein